MASTDIIQEKHHRTAGVETQIGQIKDQASKKRTFDEVTAGDQHPIDHSNKNHLEEEKKGADLN